MEDMQDTFNDEPLEELLDGAIVENMDKGE